MYLWRLGTSTNHSSRGYTRESVDPKLHPDKIDIHEGPYVSRMWLYIFCGLLDAMWQTTAYWFMGAMSNDPAKLANFSGFCKCALSIVFLLRVVGLRC